MSRKSSKAFTDTDFVMRTPEELREQLDNLDINPADAEGFIAPEYQDSEPDDAEKLLVAETDPGYPFEPVTAFVIQEVPIPKSSRAKTLKYPIGTLKAGSNESFLVPVGSSAPKAVAASIRTFGYRNGFKVIIREEGPRIRVWRKA